MTSLKRFGNAKLCYTLEFEHDKIGGVTPQHRFFYGLNQYRIADDFAKGDTTKAFIREWIDSKLLRIKWNSGKIVKVRNGRVKGNGTYFANKCAVSNSKDEPII